MVDSSSSTPKPKCPSRPSQNSLPTKPSKSNPCKHGTQGSLTASPLKERVSKPMFVPRRDSVLWKPTANLISSMHASNSSDIKPKRHEHVTPSDTIQDVKAQGKSPFERVSPKGPSRRDVEPGSITASLTKVSNRSPEPAKVRDPRLQPYPQKPASEPIPPHSSDDTTSTSLGDPSRVLVNVISSVQTQVSREYQQQYTTNPTARNGTNRQNELENQCKQLRAVLSQRDIDFAIWKSEREELLQKLEDMVAREQRFIQQEREESAYRAKLQTEMTNLLDRLRICESEKTSYAIAIQSKEKTWEEEKMTLKRTLEEQTKANETSQETVLRERKTLFRAQEKYEQEKKQWKHERAKMIDRLRDERKAREGLVAALRLRDDGHERRSSAQRSDDEQQYDFKRKRIEN